MFVQNVLINAQVYHLLCSVVMCNKIQYPAEL